MEPMVIHLKCIGGGVGSSHGLGGPVDISGGVKMIETGKGGIGSMAETNLDSNV